MLLDYQNRRLIAGLKGTVAVQQRRIAGFAGALDALSPLKVLARGYSIAEKEDGTIISKVDDAPPGSFFSLKLTDGEVPCRVERKEE